MLLRLLVIGFLGCMYITHTYAQPGTKIFADDGITGDRFGESVAISGNYAIIGATSIGTESGTGAAYIFQRQGLT